VGCLDQIELVVAARLTFCKVTHVGYTGGSACLELNRPYQLNNCFAVFVALLLAMVQLYFILTPLPVILEDDSSDKHSCGGIDVGCETLGNTATVFLGA
jgi:hypothetical protein